jgi:uncharacterized membrane protein YiaA
LSLAKYERDSHEGDYRQRMIMIGLVFLVTVALIAIGVWPAANIDASRRSSCPEFGTASLEEL